MFKVFLTKDSVKSILCCLILLTSALPVHAARVGFLQQNTPWNNIDHINSITTGDIHDRRNSATISQAIGNNQTNLIYSVKNHRLPLRDVLDTILQRVFMAQSIVSRAQRIQQPIQSQTTYDNIASGTGPALQGLFNNEDTSIKNAYSNTIALNSNQGIFMIESAIRLYHTEPKGLNIMLEELANNNQGQISDVVLVSQAPMCPCCARLILNVINNLRNTDDFPNVIAMSGAQFRTWLQSYQNQNFLQNIPQPIRNILNQPPQPGQGNKLALLIYYR